MTPAARVQAAIEVLDAILSGQPAEKALTGWARRSRFAGSKDRAAVRDHVFQALRCRRSYAVLGGSLTGRGLMLGAVRDADEALCDVFTGEGYGPAELTEGEAVAGAPTPDDLFDLPDWLIEAFRTSLDAQAEPAARASRSRAPVVLRVNLAQITRVAAADALSAEGITCLESPIADSALTVTDGARRVMNSTCYRTGKVEIQDGSSQAAMAQIPLAPGATVLDYCAGGGGKTLALAARVEAQWFAHDAEPKRMVDLPTRAARAGVQIRTVRAAALQAEAPYDLVLCDVPCSGSGTWRRTPDAKWSLTPARLKELALLQAQILRETAPLVADHGVLAYATCSVLDLENAEQITSFLSDNPDWSKASEMRWPISQHGDGFYLATLRRKN